MNNVKIKRAFVILVHAFIIWALCGATMGLGMSLTTLDNALIIHAIGAPVYAFLISSVYFTKFNYTRPLATSLVFFFFVIALDAGLVAPVIVKSYAMFASLLGI